MESKKTLTRAKSEFAETILQSVSDLPPEAAIARLSGIFSDMWNYCESEVKQMKTRGKVKEV